MFLPALRLPFGWPLVTLRTDLGTPDVVSSAHLRTFFVFSALVLSSDAFAAVPSLFFHCFSLRAREGPAVASEEGDVAGKSEAGHLQWLLEPSRSVSMVGSNTDGLGLDADSLEFCSSTLGGSDTRRDMSMWR